MDCVFCASAGRYSEHCLHLAFVGCDNLGVWALTVIIHRACRWRLLEAPTTTQKAKAHATKCSHGRASKPVPPFTNNNSRILHL